MRELLAYPEVTALIVLVLGVVCARLARIGVNSGLGYLDRTIARFSASGASVVSPALIRFAGVFVFWAVLALGIALALQVLGSAGLSALLPLVLQYVPKVIFGLLIIVAGHVLGLLASGFALNFIPGIRADSVLPRLIYGLLLLVSIVIGMSQINIDLSFVTQLLLIMAAVIGGGLALAFGLGSRQYVANILAYKEISRLHTGEVIAIGDVEGRVVDISETFVDVATADGVVSVPAAWFAEKALRHIDMSDDSV